MLQYSQEKRPKELETVLRCLILKLVNEVDTEKHQVIYDSLSKALNFKEHGKDLQLLLTLYRNCIKLKHGRRISQYAIVSIIESLNTVLHSNLQATLIQDSETKLAIAETLSLVYYYKHQ